MANKMSPDQQEALVQKVSKQRHLKIPSSCETHPPHT